MEIFQPGLNFDNLVREVISRGGVFIPHAITSEFLKVLQVELDTIEYHNYHSKPEARVREKHLAFRGRLYNHTELTHTRSLAEAISWKLRLASVPRCNNNLFYPDDLNIWRYKADDDEIAKHRDYSHDIYFVIAITVAGYGVVEFYGDEASNPQPKLWQTGPGSLMLLRSTGLCEHDNRPFHAVKSPVYGERVSLIIRQDTRNNNDHCGSKDY